MCDNDRFESEDSPLSSPDRIRTVINDDFDGRVPAVSVRVQLLVSKLLLFGQQLTVSAAFVTQLTASLRMSAVALQQNIVRVTKLQASFAQLAVQIREVAVELTKLNKKVGKTNMNFGKGNRKTKGFHKKFNNLIGAVAAGTTIFAFFLALLGAATALTGGALILAAGAFTLLTGAVVALVAAWETGLIDIRDVTAFAVGAIIGILTGIPTTLAAISLWAVYRAWKDNLFRIRDITNQIADDIINLLANLPGNAVDTIIKGFNKEFPRVYDVLTKQIDSSIATLIPFSDAKEGPLSHLTASGKALPATLAKGIKANVRPLSRASEQAALAAKPTLEAPSTPLPDGIGRQDGSSSSPVINVEVDARGASDPQAVGTAVADELRSVLPR